jgi:hypothetical protein
MYYMKKVVTVLVDEVCIYNEKLKNLEVKK